MGSRTILDDMRYDNSNKQFNSSIMTKKCDEYKLSATGSAVAACGIYVVQNSKLCPAKESSK